MERKPFETAKNLAGLILVGVSAATQTKGKKKDLKKKKVILCCSFSFIDKLRTSLG